MDYKLQLSTSPLRSFHTNRLTLATSPAILRRISKQSSSQPVKLSKNLSIFHSNPLGLLKNVSISQSSLLNSSIKCSQSSESPLFPIKSSSESNPLPKNSIESSSFCIKRKAKVWTKPFIAKKFRSNKGVIYLKSIELRNLAGESLYIPVVNDNESLPYRPTYLDNEETDDETIERSKQQLIQELSTYISHKYAIL